MSDSNERIKSITLDQASIKALSLEAEHERTVAITDIIHENQFQALCMMCGPYDVELSVRDGKLHFHITSTKTDKDTMLSLSMQPLRGTVKDYFMICDSYYDAIKLSDPHRIEAIDMARRGIHNEGSETLNSMLNGRVEVDMQTARRLFTLICVLHLK